MHAHQSKLALGIALFAAAVSGAACYPKAAPPPGSISPTSVSWAAAKWPGTTEASLAAGKETFLAKCNNCHGYPDFAAIDDEKWPSIVERMGKKADLDKAKSDAVLHYVLASKHP